jgi:hypothetical protein
LPGDRGPASAGQAAAARRPELEHGPIPIRQVRRRIAR